MFRTSITGAFVRRISVAASLAMLLVLSAACGNKPALDSPDSVIVTVIDPTHVLVSWEPVTGATGYVVERHELVDAALGKTWRMTSDTHSLIDEFDFLPGVAYLYRVFSMNEEIPSEIGSDSVAQTINVPPASPASVSVTPVTFTSVVIFWEAAEGATGYRVARYETGSNTPIDQWATTVPYSADAFDFVIGVSYVYGVVALNSALESTERLSGAVIPNALPLQPASFEAQVIDHLHVSLLWSPVTGSDGYVVERFILGGTAPDATFPLDASVPGMIDTFSFPFDTEYFYRLFAIKMGSQGPASDSNTITPNTTPSAPAMVTATVDSKTQVTVNWAPVEGGFYYEVSRLCEGEAEAQAIWLVPSTCTTYVDNFTFRIGAQYRYSVRAAFANGSSPSMSSLQVSPNAKVIAVATRQAHCLAVCSDGTVYAWGENGEGQLGLGDRSNRNTPTLVSTLSGKGVISITAGYYHNFALCSDGSVYTWGANWYGELGLGDTVNRTTPTLLPSLSDKGVVALSGGHSHSLALCSDGSVYAWGWNGYGGPLGLGDNTNRYIPTLVTDLAGKSTISVAAGANHTLALCSDGSVYACGLNDFGQLGLGDNSNRNAFMLVTALSDKGIVALSQCYDQSFAISSDDSVYAWGWNAYGQLGLGDTVSRNTPTLVPSLSNKGVTVLPGGYHHSLAFCSDATVYTCGANDFGQLGLGDNTGRSTFTLVTALSGKAIISAAMAYYHGLVLCSDGSLFSWGGNVYGSLGVGDNTNRNTPTLIPSISPQP